MPEGDTVWLSARTLDRALSGSVLTRAELRVPQLATSDLRGREVVATLSRGKHLLTRFGPAPGRTAGGRPGEPGEPGGPGGPGATGVTGVTGGPLTLHTHLKMEGSWHVVAPGGRWRRPAHEARVVLETERWQAVGFSLGVVELLPTDQEHTVVGHLGPDLLDAAWGERQVEDAVSRLLADPDRALADALLDQRVVAGLGNLYKNELCFVLGVHPLDPVTAVRDPRRLVSRARQMLWVNREHPQQATTGDTRRGHQHWVYRRERQRCRRCGTPVEVAMSGEPGADGTTRERATYWCPRCQPRTAGA